MIDKETIERIERLEKITILNYGTLDPDIIEEKLRSFSKFTDDMCKELAESRKKLEEAGRKRKEQHEQWLKDMTESNIEYETLREKLRSLGGD